MIFGLACQIMICFRRISPNTIYIPKPYNQLKIKNIKHEYSKMERVFFERLTTEI